jgi:transcriptional regulator with XRE-family HTH domain
MSNPPEPIGALLGRLRRDRGWTQARVADRLCDLARTPTLTRHDVSRWERERRVPGPFWLPWLAVVLDTPLERLEAAVAATTAGSRSAAARPPADPHRLWRPPAATDLLAALDHGNVHDVRELAHTWLAGPPAPEPSPAVAVPGTGCVVAGAGSARVAIEALTARLAALRRLDDQLGGLDLAGRIDRELRAAISVLRTLDPGSLRLRAMSVVAGYAQLAGWAHVDAGDGAAARRAHRVALHAAATAGDRQLAGYVLGALSHHSLTAGAPQEALLLARTAYTGVRTSGTPLTRTLLLHRIALAAAHLGERRLAELTLCQAEQVADRSGPDPEPDWLYWLDAAERAAMTGRCLAVLGRSLRAVRLLAAPAGAGPRTAALYATWLARSHLALGEVEQACRTAIPARSQAMAAGSARAAVALRRLHPLLLRHCDVPAVRRYQRIAAATATYLPTPGPTC